MTEPRLCPPADLVRYVGSPDAEQFLAVGREFNQYFRDFAGLQPGDRVLDLGCGCGRMAIPMTEYLGPDGRYDGLDISRDCIAWASAEITGRFPNFHFHHADIRNTMYNPTGAIAPHEFRLPFGDETFDVVVLASVFTHLLPRSLERFLGEIARVTKLGGRNLISYFVMTPERDRACRDGLATFQFAHARDGVRVQYADHPEYAVAYPRQTVERLYRRYGLELTGPIRYGTWGGGDGLSFQDIVVGRKVRAVATWWNPLSWVGRRAA